jgi:sec-independent protein translocase protein TatB
MNFLGIGPGEFFFILIVALLVVGPERLPDFARSIGRNIVRLRNWMNTSPDAQLFVQVQRELQGEIADIRATLRQEMQIVRAEVESVRGDLNTASRTVDTSLQSAATAANIAPPRPASIPSAATPNNTPMTDTAPVNPPPPTPAAVAATIAATQTTATVNDTTQTPPATSDVTTPMTIEAITEAPLSNGVVARSRKPNWANPTTATTDENTSDVPVDVDQLHQTLQHERQQFSAEIATLRQEIQQIKQLGATASATVSHDAFTMMRIEVEQLSRDLKATRSELQKAQQPATGSVSHDAFMMMKIEVGRLTQRIDELNQQLTNRQQNSES